MQDRYTFSNLPAEISLKISSHLQDDLPTLANLSQASRQFFGLFRKELLIPIFLKHVAYGKQVQIVKMLEQHPYLLTWQGNVTDYAGRQFKNVSGFQLMLWMLDVHHMGQAMLACLPKNVDGEKIRSILRTQLEEVKKTGITYKFENETYSEKHYDFSPLLTALQTHWDNFPRWSKSQRKENWIKNVGGAQRLIPAHVIHHYCNPETLIPLDYDWSGSENDLLSEETKIELIDMFKTQKNLDRKIDFINLLEKSQLWFPCEKLGKEFAILYSHSDEDYTPVTAVATYSGHKNNIEVLKNLVVIKALAQTRIEEFNEFEQLLENANQPKRAPSCSMM